MAGWGFWAGCGGGGAVGPESAASFSLTTVGINPTLEFFPGQQLTYSNAVGTAEFPEALVAVAGVYSYAPANSFKSGTLFLELGAPLNRSITVQVRNFRRDGPRVVGFQAVVDGVTFPATVQSGQLLARVSGN